MHANRKLIVKAVVVTLGTLACIFLGLQAWVMVFMDRTSQDDPSQVIPTLLIPTFLLTVGILSVVNFIRGFREGKKRQSTMY